MFNVFEKINSAFWSLLYWIYKQIRILLGPKLVSAIVFYIGGMLKEFVEAIIYLLPGILIIFLFVYFLEKGFDGFYRYSHVYKKYGQYLMKYNKMYVYYQCILIVLILFVIIAI